MQTLHALVLENGTLLTKTMQDAEKLPALAAQAWPKAYPVITADNRPTEFHTCNGETEGLDGEQWVIVPQWSEPDLAAVKATLKARVDSRAESIRMQFITAGSGQAMVYQRKAQEAQACLNDPSPDPANYPVLAASIGIEGDTLADVADMVAAKENLWAQIAAAIEAARLGGKAAIDAAETAVAAVAAYGAIDWSLPQ